MGKRVLVLGLAIGAVALVALTNPRSNDPRCDVPRAAIMTLSDSGDVRLQPEPTTVEQLLQVRRPHVVSKTKRSRPVEARTYKIKARLIAWRKLPDSHIDLVVTSGKKHAKPMTVVFEGTRQCSHSAVARGATAMTKAKEDLYAACGKPHKRRVPLTGTAEITGVGFFGHTIGAGHAHNGIELHPVLSFKSADCSKA